ncbi:MAG: hypothetical protein KAT70_07615, partial [Thermoplasmata archaeon]|nr:hypothetical protein [Thermoplasmata archaeon]
MLRKVQTLVAAILVFSFIANIPFSEATVLGSDSHPNAMPSDVEYPRGYTHRPFIGFYTGL